MSYRSNNYVSSDVVSALWSGWETESQYTDKHLVQERPGCGVSPWFQINYHAPKALYGRVQPFIGVVAAHGDRDDTLNVYEEIIGHNAEDRSTCVGLYDASHCPITRIWSTWVIQRTLLSTIPGPKWAGWELGATVGADIDLWKDKDSTSVVSLRGGYTKIFGPIHPGAWQIGPVTRW
jgi:hypothetical protein